MITSSYLCAYNDCSLSYVVNKTFEGLQILVVRGNIFRRRVQEDLKECNFPLMCRDDGLIVDLNGTS